MKVIKDLMTPSPHACVKNDSMLSVAGKMLKHNVGAIPVVDEDKKVVGIITDRDIVRAIFRKNTECENNSCSIKDITAQEAMTSEVYTVNLNEDAAYALNLMREKKIGRLPIVDNDNNLMGMISFNSISRNIFLDDIEKEGRENIIDTMQSMNDRNERIDK